MTRRALGRMEPPFTVARHRQWPRSWASHYRVKVLRVKVLRHRASADAGP